MLEILDLPFANPAVAREVVAIHALTTQERSSERECREGVAGRHAVHRRADPIPSLAEIRIESLSPGLSGSSLDYEVRRGKTHGSIEPAVMATWRWRDELHSGEKPCRRAFLGR